ncbi:hypothetical protein ASC94_24630 [Massilia sp. Root418]|uniref:DUF1345 domain-containing protein n=1 Tax=Massilia sp. Root418 TaxID=1736532 RepID=UPI000701BCAB|nr:DUF1345 domain-containing protein [Massilia sp. Root418]KQW88594.1 hypothetical protein ASC94_24630 [Massilia sp. Root418]
MKIFPDLIHRRPHLALAIALGALSGPFLPDGWRTVTRILAGWDVAVWAYLVTMGWMMMRADHRKVKRVAAKEDERGPVILAVLCVAAMVSLLAIVSELAALHGQPLEGHVLEYALVGLTLIGSWFLVGTLFCFHYAHLYYQATPNARPLQFPGQHHEPDYWDFLYFSFTIAVAAQTSDVVVRSAALRKLVLGQSVLSFFFNLFILGLSVNIAAGLMNN